jgi:hypothetical protein
MGGKDNVEYAVFEFRIVAFGAGKKYGGDIDVVLSNVHPPPKPLKLHVRGIQKSIQPSRLARRTARKGIEHTWLTYPVEEESESEGK